MMLSVPQSAWRRARVSRVAASIVAVEGAGGVVAGLGFAIAALVGHPADRATAVLLGVLLAVYGAAILFVARGVDRDRRWARVPAFLIQFFALVVAWYQRGTLPAVTAVLAVVALLAVAALVATLRDQPV
jgi:hypothetical protein